MKKKSTKKPKVSIILATYNRADLLRRCISSLLIQTFKDFELIIADDGSRDETEYVVGSFADPRIVYVRHKHGGCYRNRNKALRVARADLIAVADDDDLYHPNHIQVLYDMFERDPDLGCAYGGTLRYRQDGKLEGHTKPKPFSFVRLLFGKIIMHGNTMWLRRWMEKCPYPIQYEFGGDYIFCIEAAKKGCKFASTGQTTYSYYMYQDSMTRRCHPDQRRNLHSGYIKELLNSLSEDEKYRFHKEIAELHFERYIEEVEPKVSFLVPYYKQAAVLDNLIESIRLQTKDYQNIEIIICNHGSAHINLSKYYDLDVKYIWRQHRGIPSLATSRNYLMKMSSGDILFFVDSDMTIPEGTLLTVIRRHYDDNYSLLMHSLYENGRPRRTNNSRIWQSMCGTYSIRKSVALKIGFQDPAYDENWGFEDTDWAYRAFKLGVHLEYGRDIRIDHTPHPHNTPMFANRKIFESKHGISAFDDS